MSFGMTNMMTVPGSNAKTGALFEGLCVPADSAAVLKRSTAPGAPRVQSAIRNQVELRVCDLDASLPADHQARAVWAFVQSLDLQGLYARIKAVEGSVGRAPIDPAILPWWTSHAPKNNARNPPRKRTSPQCRASAPPTPKRA